MGQKYKCVQCYLIELESARDRISSVKSPQRLADSGDIATDNMVAAEIQYQLVMMLLELCVEERRIGLWQLGLCNHFVRL